MMSAGYWLRSISLDLLLPRHYNTEPAAMFENLSKRLNDVFDQLRRRGKLSEADVDTAMREVRLALLEADVHYGVVKTLIARIRERAVGAEVSKALNPGQHPQYGPGSLGAKPRAPASA